MKGKGKGKYEEDADGDIVMTSGADPSVQGPSQSSSRGPLRCAWCKEGPKVVQELYLLYIGDWQGGVHGICYGCMTRSEEHGPLTPVQFKEQVGKRINQRKKAAGKHSGLARGIDWKKAMNQVGNMHSGQSKAEWREAVKGAVKALAVLAKAAFDKMSEFCKRRFVVAFREQKSNLDRIAENAEYVPQHGPVREGDFGDDGGADHSVQARGAKEGADGSGTDLSVQDRDRPLLFWVPERALDWASEVITGVDQYYLCRLSTCRAFMPNTAWIKERDHDWYRCPVCASEYFPWKFKSTFITPNKVMVAAPPDEETAAALSMVHGEHKVWLVLWEDTAQAVLARRMQEICLKLSVETQKLTPDELEKTVRNKVEANAERVFFQRRQLSKTVQDEIDGINASTSKRFWEYRHLEEGFWAAQAPEFNDGTPYMKNDDVVVMWAYAKEYALGKDDKKRGPNKQGRH